MRQPTTFALRLIMTIVSALMMLGSSAGFVSSQSDAKYGDFLDAEGITYIEKHGCGQYWPSKGLFQTTREAYEVSNDNPFEPIYSDLDNYGAVLTFQLTQAEKDELLCAGEYLEIDFHLFGLATPAQWDAYSVSTNIPGAVHDTAATDSADQATPGLTYIRVSDLIVNHEYYAGISFTGLWPNNDGKPRVSFEWVPSRWATRIDEVAFCKEFRMFGEAMCIFGNTRAFLSHGYTHQEYGTRESLVFDGFRFWEFSGTSASPVSSNPTGPQSTTATSATCTDRGVPVVTSPLTFSPAEASVGSEVTYSFTIRNDGCNPFAPVVLAIGGHSSNGIEDAYQSRDFILAPNESRTVTHTDVREMAGNFEYYVAFMDQEGDWHRVPGTGGTSQSVYQTVTAAGHALPESAPPPSASCSDTGVLHSTSRLVASPDNPTTTTEMTLSVTLVNESCGTFAPEVLAIGGRDPSGNVTDPLQTREFVLGPGESTTITQTVVLTTPGTHEFFMAYLRVNGGWHRIPDASGDSSSIYVNVTDAGQVQADPVQPTAAPAQAAPTTEPIVSSETTDVTPPPAQETQTQVSPTSSGEDDSNIIEPVNGTETVNTSSTSNSGTTATTTSSPSGTSDIALITRDPADGHLLTGACYVLANYSLVGCDENSDGQVTFAAIPHGTYTVRQTTTPAGYPPINDFQITVAGTGYMEAPSVSVPLGFLVKQAPEQNAPNTRNVSVVFLDMASKQRITTGACVQLLGASNVGCDEDLVDGQIDFLDVPAGGPYELRFSNLPSGYQVATVGGPLAVTVNAEAGAPTTTMVFVLLAASNGSVTPANSSSGNAVIEPTSSTASSEQSTSQATTGSATLLITMRGCPEGFNPNTDDFFANCTIPLDAPDASFLYHGGDGQGGMNIMWMDRQYDGAYIFNAGPNTMNVQLSGLAPTERDAYVVIGHDSESGGGYNINLVNGETRQVYVFYYYWP